MSYDDFDVDKARELREKAKDAIFRESRKNFIITLLASIPVMVLAGYASVNWADPFEPGSGTLYALMYLIALILLVDMWAKYAMDSRLLFLLKEIKQLRLDFLSSTEAPLESATGGAESLVTWASGALKPKTLVVVLVIVGALTGVGISLAYSLTHTDNRTFGGQEVVEAHVTPEGAIRVVSRLSITRCAADVALIPLRVPQPGAVIESVTVDGRKVPFEPVADAKDTYAVMPGLPEEALKDATLEVVWMPQASDIRIHQGVRYFELPLQGLVPFTAYTANAVLDEGAPYEFAYPGKSSSRSLPLFWTKRPTGDYFERSMGICTLAYKPSQTGE